MDLDFSAWQPYLLTLAFVSLALLGAGFAVKDRRRHLLRAAGWVLFGLYWPFQAPEFFWPTMTSEPDPINGWFTLLGPLFLWYIAYHEWKSFQWNEDPKALKWFAGASFTAALTYFVIYELPPVTEWIIHQTTLQSAWMYNWVFFGGEPRAFVVQDSFLGPEGFRDSHICLPDSGGLSQACPGSPAHDYAVTVVLACTAIQSIMIFVGAIACLEADGRRKRLGYLYTVPVIYALNLFRNAGIVYGYKDLDWGMFGIDSFEWMHSYVGKIGSLVAMVFIALAVFATLPELHHNILDLFDLRKRKAPGFFAKRPPPPEDAAAPPPAEATP
ncbi:MAG TPA: archaeosortase A [Candidatus Thermoplasmatota archaeon]|nr:archaeosortase A [Candidatus Thermoplasmatota archaeon]